MSYTESLQKIRAARTDRDTVKDNLYTLQLQYLTLKKQQQKAAGKDIAEDSETTQLIDRLRKEMAVLQEQLNQVTTQIIRDQQNNIPPPEDLLQQQKELTRRIGEEQQQLSSTIRE